jgi:serine/threonine protein kinase
MPDSLGQPFGKYVLLDRLATGGMAEIFRANCASPEGDPKQVVIKRILPHFVHNEAFVSMFANEAKIAASLSHDNIARVFDFGEVDGEYFLAMELVEGPALSRLARRSQERGLQVPVPVALHIIAEILKGLHYAHTRADEQGQPLSIVHCDVSPQNILISYEGQVKLVDFGIARMRTAGSGEDLGKGQGKFRYFSPEQAKGNEVDGRSDVFAAGIVLYELLTGRRPFDGSMSEVLDRVSRADYAPASTLNPDLPPGVEAILAKALTEEPRDRYATAEEMHDALEALLRSIDPSFAAESVGFLARHLFREELEAKGVQVQVPQEFMEQLDKWTPAQFTSEGAVVQSDPALPRRATVSISSAEVNTSKPPSRPTPRPFAALLMLERLALILAGIAALVGLIGLGYGLIQKPGSFALEVVTKPPGAAVVLDGRETGQVTPAKLEGLASSSPHAVDLKAAGFKAYHADVPAPQGGRARVEAALEKIEPPKPPPPPPKPVAATPAPAPAKAELPGPVAVWPKDEIHLKAREDAWNVATSAAGKLKLDPKKTYRMALEPAPPPRKKLPAVFFFGERARGAGMVGSVGPATPKAPGVTVTGLTALYGFVLDAAPRGSTWSPRIKVTELKAKRPAVLLLPIDPTRSAIAPDDRLPHFSGLDPRVSYSVTVTSSTDFAKPVKESVRLFFLKTGDGGGEAGVLEAGTPAVVRGVKELFLLLPDEELGDNKGEIVVRIAAAKKK